MPRQMLLRYALGVSSWSRSRVSTLVAVASLFAAPLGAQEPTSGVENLTAAAKQGDAVAQFALGHMYYNGKGVPQDYVLAHKWSNLAASRSSGQDGENFRKTRNRLAGTITWNLS